MGDTWVFKKKDERTNQRAGHTARSTEKIMALNFTPAQIFLKFKNDKVKKSSLQTDGCGSGDEFGSTSKVKKDSESGPPRLADGPGIFH